MSACPTCGRAWATVAPPEKFGLTARQRELLDFIRSYMAQYDMSPSFDEMAAHLKLTSKSGVHRLLTGLVERGHVRRLEHRVRAIEIIEAQAS